MLLPPVSVAAIHRIAPELLADTRGEALQKDRFEGLKEVTM
jgi:hypothetical protein